MRPARQPTDALLLTQSLYSLAGECLILAGSAVLAVLLANLLISEVITALLPAWPTGLRRIALLLLWPFARLLGQTPTEAGLVATLLTMLVVLAIVVAGVAVLRRFARQALLLPPSRPPQPWRMSGR